MSDYDAKRDAALSYDVAIAEMRRRKEWREKLTAAKRVEFIGNCMMIQGDCLDVMPQIGKVDAVVTDPPYGIGDIMVGSGHFAGLCKRMGGENGWDKSPPPKHVFENEFPTIAWGGQLSRTACITRLACLGKNQRRSDICGN